MYEKPRPSLLKYNVPILSSGETHVKKNRNANTLRSSGKAKSLLNNDGQDQMLTRDILNMILPPRQYNDNGQDLIQYVSTNPATKTDVTKLQTQLDKELQENKVREIGIDSVRSEIYGQCFDEIIRQVTIDCSARGLLLVRIRDEMKTTISKFQTLYESAITWGMRKAMEKEQNKDMLIVHKKKKSMQAKLLS